MNKLFLISLGLEEGDISLKAVEAMKKCNKVYLESYTSIGVSLKYLERLLKKKIEQKPREFFENNSKEITKEAKKGNIALLIRGDCLSATTHISILQEAEENNIETEIIHGVSIFTAVNETGLSLYNFGKTASIPFENKNVKTPYNIVKTNLERGMHTLVLLDLNPNENKFLSTGNGLNYLVKNGLNEKTKAVICSRIGTKDRKIKFGEIKDLVNIEPKDYPQCIIIVGNTHFAEEDYLNKFRV